MPKLRYKAPNANRVRVFRPADLERLGLPGFEQDLIFEKSNHWTLELPEAACETLLRVLPDQFEALETPSFETESTPVEAGNPTDDEAVDESGADDPQESPDDSLSEADAAIDESPQAKRRRR